MIIYFSESHHLHAPEYEFYRGERVPCFESPVRANIVQQALEQARHEFRVPEIDSRSVLSKIHSKRYLGFLQSAWAQWLELDPKNKDEQPFPSVWPIRTLRSEIEPDNFIAKLGLYSMDNGSPMASGTWQAAKAGADAAASAATEVSEQVTEGERGAAFCATRPPGHHAGADFMGGYCFINNAAVAAQTLLDLGHENVAILDVDFHHGNGTQSIFYSRSDVLFTSIHGDPKTEYPFYLGHADETGEGEGSGYNLNLPLPAGSSANIWFASLNKAIERITQFGASALVVSLGLDTYAGDPISNFELETDDFKILGKRIAEIGLPTVMILEGGYATAELGLNTSKVIEGFEQT